MKKSIITITTLILAAFISCEKNSEYVGEQYSNIEVSFAGAQILTRTTGNLWEDDDRVGIYMYVSDASSLNRENVEYSTDTKGNFSIETNGQTIYYPQSNSVDLYAYYPYSSTVSGTSYTIDITAQNIIDSNTGLMSFDHGVVDFLTASLSNQSKSEDVVTFNFDHRLSMLTLELTANNGLTSLEGVSVELENINSIGIFNTLTGEMINGGSEISSSIEFSIETTDIDELGNVKSMTATAIVLPETLSENALIGFTLSDGTYLPALFTAPPTFAAGYNHIYAVTVGYYGAQFKDGNTIAGWGSNDALTDSDIAAEEE